jgi:hypothetical protein
MVKRGNLMTKGFGLLFLVVVVGLIGLGASSDPAAALPVEYVKICSLYGAGFAYLPGTDICINFATNDARQQTEGGTWRWRVPNSPRTWVPTLEEACQDGHLIKFGAVTGSGLALNSHTRYETNTHYRLRLRQGQYIESVLYKGGFTGVGRGNFCMFYNWDDPVFGPSYSFPLGCIDTSSQANVPATLVFSPDTPIPPATVNDIYVVGANGDPWNVVSAAEIQGTLSVWLCVQDAPGSGRGH